MTRFWNSTRAESPARPGGDGISLSSPPGDRAPVSAVGSRRRSARAWTIAGFVAATLALIVAAVWWSTRPSTRAFYTDGVTVREEVPSARRRDVLWQPPIRLAAVINTSDEDFEPRLSWDENTLYLVRGKPGGNADIFIAHRTPTGFGEPERLAAVCSEFDDLGPEPSRDGRSLYFYSNRPGGCGGYDIWVALNIDGQWQPPTNLGLRINSEYNDYGPAVSPDGATLYFASNRPQPGDTRQPQPDAWPATVREDLYRRTYDLYRCALTVNGPALPVAITLLNTGFNEAAPCVSPGGDFLYFTSDRPGGFGGFDLYRARLVRGELRPAENLGPAVNTAANELDPGLAAIGFGLYFSSDRPVTRLDPNHPNDYNLYYSASRDVFLTTEAAQTAGLDWAALWRAVLPNLLWGLLALLLLLLLFALCSDARRRRLSLITRCLLASLALHALLLFAMTFWKVTAVVVDAVRGRGELQIALAPGAAGDSLIDQVRGHLTDLVAPQFAAAAEIPMPPPAEADPSVAPVHFDTPQTTLRPDPLQLPVQSAEVDLSPQISPPAAMTVLRTDSPLDLALPLDTPPRAVATEPAYHAPVAAPSSEQAAVPVVVNPIALSDAMLPIPLRADPLPNETAGFATMPSLDPDRPLDRRLPGSPPPATLEPAPAASVSVALPHDLPASAQPAGESEIRAAAVAPNADGERAPALTPPSAPASGTQYAVPAPPTKTDQPQSLPGRVILPQDAIVRVPVGIAATQPAADTARQSIENLRLPAPASRPIAPSADEAESSPRPLAVASPADAGRAPISAISPADMTREVGTVALPPGSLQAAPEPGFTSLPAETRPASPIEPVRAPVLDRLRPPETDAVTSALRLPDESADTTNALPGGRSATDRPMAQHAAHQGTDLRLSGRVSLATTDQPLSGALVRADMSDGEPVAAYTDGEGRYELLFPDMPAHFALTASHSRALPKTENVASADLRAGGMVLDFKLEPRDRNRIVLEAVPDVHHLGNDRFEGRINSQFQKYSEGLRYRAFFELPPGVTVRRARLKMMTRGVQCPHPITINNEEVARLHRSPESGRFGRFAVSFDPAVLQAGSNVLEIRATSCMGDIDDFEFVNVQIELES